MSYHSECAKSSFMKFPHEFVKYIPCDCAVFDNSGKVIAYSDSFNEIYLSNQRNIDFIIEKVIANFAIKKQKEKSASSNDATNYIVSLNAVDYNISVKYINNYIIMLLQNITKNIEIIFEKSNRDFLTNLWNRRAFTEKIETILMDDADIWASYKMIGLDIDLFKNINDLFGHPAGDEVIKGVAQCCTQSIRPTDIAGRWGGEEFFLFVHASTHEAFAIAERLREKVNDMTFFFDGKKASCSISLGVSGEHIKRPSMDTLIKEADQALYTAKKTGRNKTIIYS